ncbi:MAG: class I SAM-dependent methyltransferase [Pyrinomonadaceae bacterium]
MTPHLNLQEWFGQIDIYLFDQLLKGRFNPRMRVLDAGCGGGRNLIYFLRCGYDVGGVDLSTEAIAHVRALAAGLAPHLPADNFRVEAVEGMSFADAGFDVVISSAVLHFARDEEHWQDMLREMWRVLKPGGIFFARLASSVGLEEQIIRLEGKRYRLPDGSDRFLVDDRMLLAAADSLGGELFEPLKTVVVRNLRSMSTWCLRKS